jgi:hypothetical protein
MDTNRDVKQKGISWWKGCLVALLILLVLLAVGGGLGG